MDKNNTANNKNEINNDYYIDEPSGFLVFTKHYLMKKGICCGLRCRHCPYTPKHTTGSTNILK